MPDAVGYDLMVSETNTSTEVVRTAVYDATEFTPEFELQPGTYLYRVSIHDQYFTGKMLKSR